MTAHGLQNDLSLHPVAQLVQSLQANDHNALQRRLGHIQNPSAGEMLAQQHTEHGRLVGIFPGKLGQLCSGMGGIGRYQQLHVAARGAQGEDDLIPAGLVDLVDLCPGQSGVQFPDKTG